MPPPRRFTPDEALQRARQRADLKWQEARAKYMALACHVCGCSRANPDHVIKRCSAWLREHPDGGGGRSCALPWRQCPTCGREWYRRTHEPYRYCPDCHNRYGQGVSNSGTVLNRLKNVRVYACEYCGKTTDGTATHRRRFCSKACSAHFYKISSRLKRVVAPTGVLLKEVPIEIVELGRAYRELNKEIWRRRNHGKH